MVDKELKEIEKASKAVFGGALTLQAVPLLRPEGRTLAALTDTATGFVGIGVAGATSDVAFRLVSPRKRVSRKKKGKGR